MDPRIKERFNQTILNDILQRYAVTADAARELDGFESFIYEFTRPDGDFILRIGHSQRRSIPMIRGEVDWINYLAAGGAGVAKAIFSEQGSLVELAPDGQGEHFLATAFVKAPGGRMKREHWTPNFYEVYGALLGRMHALTKQYTPPAETWRPHWDDPIHLSVDEFLPPEDSAILENFNRLLDHLHALPRDLQSYGLIHFDAHTSNLFVDDHADPPVITLFDFDDCAYSWFANDIAIVLFYAISMAKDPPQATRDFLVPFLRGYRRENHLDPAWLAEIPHFLKLREIDLYAVIHRSLGPGPYDDSPWVAHIMDGRRERLAADVPYVTFDFAALHQEM